MGLLLPMAASSWASLAPFRLLDDCTAPRNCAQSVAQALSIGQALGLHMHSRLQWLQCGAFTTHQACALHCPSSESACQRWPGCPIQHS